MNRRGKELFKKKNAQVWVETVIYTLIGLAIIGLLLGISKPQLDKIKDRALIEQAINGLGIVDEKIYDILGGIGNKRRIELKIGKGEFTVDSENDKIIWEIDSHFEYSETGLTVQAGKINVTTLPASPYKIVLEVSYPFDIRFNNQSTIKQFGQSATPHVLTVENLGIQGSKTVINFNDV